MSVALTATDNSRMTRSEVRVVQNRLVAHGYEPGPIDGILGPRTNAAIIAFKRNNGFVSRPYVGPQTWAKLVALPMPTILAPLTSLPWLGIGRKFLGRDERRDNTELREFLASDGHALGDPSVFPWCGDYVETCIRLALPNEPFTGRLAQNPYWALNWREFGVPCQPVNGCVTSISRNGGGHVAFVVGQNDRYYFCLGGNQSNSVSIAPIDKARFVPASFRWPATVSLKSSALPYYSSTAKAENSFA